MTIRLFGILLSEAPAFPRRRPSSCAPWPGNCRVHRSARDRIHRPLTKNPRRLRLHSPNRVREQCRFPFRGVSAIAPASVCKCPGRRWLPAAQKTILLPQPASLRYAKPGPRARQGPFSTRSYRETKTPWSGAVRCLSCLHSPLARATAGRSGDWPMNRPAPCTRLASK